MFVGPSIFMIFLFLFYPAIRTIYLSFGGRFSDEFVGLKIIGGLLLMQKWS